MKNKQPEKNARGRDLKKSGSRVASLARSRANQATAIITLLTDFGTADYFVGAMKGAILSVNPAARIVDITHEIPPQDIQTGAFTLLGAYSSFPPGTTHVAVVDPGVGSARRPILIKTPRGFFVGPDNGIFSYVCDSEERLGSTFEIFHLNNACYFRHPVSPTFNGRDLFAPVAAALSKGVQPFDLGTSTSRMIRLEAIGPRGGGGKLIARIIHIDRFGNCVTNITHNDLTTQMITAGATLRLKGRVVKSFRKYFAEVTGSKDKLFAVWGSSGFLEIVATNASAAELMSARCGDAVTVSKG